MKPLHFFLIILAVVLIAGGAWYAGSLNRGASTTTPSDRTIVAEDVPGEETTGTYAGENTLVPLDQKPSGMIRVTGATLAQNGFVAVHADNNGNPGEIIGSTTPLDAGEHPNLDIPLARDTADGEKLYLMIHADTDKNGEFDENMDKPARGAAGDVVMAVMRVDVNAVDPFAQ